MNKSSKKHRLSIAFFYEPNLEMEMPKGVTLKRKGNFKDVKTYGEHVYRAY
jgi:isopenicillin N synthase-like dioxygenase